MAQETDKTSFPHVMLKQETMTQLMGETMDPTTMVNNEEWDLDQLDYNVYEKCFIDFRLRVKQEERHDELFSKKKEVSKNSKLTINDITVETSETDDLSDNQTHIEDNDDNQEDNEGFENDCGQGNLIINDITVETSETNDLSDNQTNIEDNDVNQEDDDGFENDCGQGNLIIDEQTQLSNNPYDRRKYLFSPRHFQEDNLFELSISSCKNLNYSSIKTKNKNHTFKPLKLAKQTHDHIQNVTTISRVNLKYKKSNLLTPINKDNLPIKKRIKNVKFESNISSASTNNTLSPSALMPTNNYSPRLTLMYTSTNSKIWYDPVNDLYIPFVPIVSDVNLLLK